MNSDRYYDARIGFPVSHGCLRMYNDDIWWMYNNIPQRHHSGGLLIGSNFCKCQSARTFVRALCDLRG